MSSPYQRPIDASRHPGKLFLWNALMLLLPGALALGAGFATFGIAETSSSSSDVWASLEFVLLGLFVGVVVFVATFVVLLVVGSRRFFLPGQRLKAAGLAFLAFLVGIFLVTLSALVPYAQATFLLVPFVVVAPALVWWSLCSTRARSVLARLLVVCALLVVFSALVLWVLDRMSLASETREIPWGVSSSPEEPATGWERDPFEKTRISSQDSWSLFPSQGVYVKYLTPEHGVAFVLLVKKAPVCTTTPEYSCVQEDGLLLFTESGKYATRQVLVRPIKDTDVSAGAWAVSFEGDPKQPRAVLADLNPVSLVEFQERYETQVDN